jgi:hypothetical protein
MSPEGQQFEHSFEAIPQQIPVAKFEKQENLDNNIFAIRERAKDMGVMLDGDLRIDMLAAEHPQKDEHLQYLKRSEEWETAKREKLADKVREQVEAREEYEEKLGKLVVIIFNKFLGENFLAVRSSLYDKKKEGVGILILNKKTGGLVCAFNEVGAIEDRGNADKCYQTFEKNIKSDKLGNSGVELSYGLKLERPNMAKVAERKNIPVFYLALGKTHIDRGLRQLSFFKEKTNQEKDLFIHLFHRILGPQIEFLADKKNLNQELKNNLKEFNQIFQMSLAQEKGRH